MIENFEDNNQILEEFKRCKSDPVYFLCNYIKVTHPVRGLVNFELYDFQKTIIGELQNNRFNILRKFRQAGCTTIAASYALWMAVFEKHKAIVILSKGDSEACEVLDRIKVMYDNLPEFFKPGIIEDNKHTLKLQTHSVIKSRPSGKQSGRSLAGSFLIIDEAAFIESIDTIWAAVYPIISTGGRAFILSTVNGVGNWFYDVYNKAMEGGNSFNPIDIEWKQHPEYFRHKGYDHLYDQMLSRNPPLKIEDWEEITRSNMPLKQWLQEYECSFLGTGDTFIDSEILKEMNEHVTDDYYIKYNNKMRIWQDPDPYYDYMISCDVSLGRDRDYSAFHIINLYNGEQVAEFYSNKTPINEFAEIISREATLYNTAYVVCERNTIGNNLIDWLYNNLEYENLWCDDTGSFGLQLTVKNRDSILAELEEAARRNFIKINSRRTIDELFTFIVTDTGKVQADKGKHDDLVMSLAAGVHVYKTIMEGTPLEFMEKPNKNIDNMMPSKRSSKKYQGISKENYKWLMS
tara:strand:+ start:1591 stop:3144 length:1554 start_codon:yes stop_codon:yes gene_type:complete